MTMGDNNNQALNYLLNQFVGNVRPITPKRTFTANEFEDKIEIAKVTTRDAEYVTSLKVFIPELSIDYPKPNIFLYFRGTKSSSFVRIDFNQFNNLVFCLQETKDKLESLRPQLEDKSLKYQAKRAEVDVIKAQAQALKNMPIDTDFGIPPEG